MSALRSGRSYSLDGSGGADTYYTETFRPEATARRISAQAKRISGSGTITITLQGGWADSVSGTATDWVDIDFDTAALNSAQLTELKTTAGDAYVFAAFPVYRLKFVVASAAAVGTAHVVFF